jgi:hypothetical protein
MRRIRMIERAKQASGFVELGGVDFIAQAGGVDCMLKSAAGSNRLGGERVGACGSIHDPEGLTILGGRQPTAACIVDELDYS